MQKIVLLLLTTLLLMSLVLPGCTGEQSKPKLSEMSDAELWKILEDYGIEFPNNFGLEDARAIVTELEADPQHLPPPIAVSISQIPDLYEDIRELVCEYYGIGNAENR